MSEPRLLIAGIGNIFLGDDAFGCLVARELGRRPLVDGVRVEDFGIRGIDLALATSVPYECIIMVDAAPRGGIPGTLYLIQPEVEEITPEYGMPVMDMHSMDPVRVLRLARVFGGRVDHVLILGCEPSTSREDPDPPEALSSPVAAAVPSAVSLLESLVKQLLVENPLVLANSLHRLTHPGRTQQPFFTVR